MCSKRTSWQLSGHLSDMRDLACLDPCHGCLTLVAQFDMKVAHSCGFES